MLLLSQSFFRRPVLAVAPELLGKLLVRRREDGEILRARINEVEAYDGENDLACHASRGRTERNAPMYEPGGVWYVYLCYGMHFMLNIVTGDKNYPAAVLIRGVEGAVGPGRVTKKLLIDKSLNAQKANRAGGLWVESDGLLVAESAIIQAPRVGVEYAGEWADKPYRFSMKS